MNCLVHAGMAMRGCTCPKKSAKDLEIETLRDLITELKKDEQIRELKAELERLQGGKAPPHVEAVPSSD